MLSKIQGKNRGSLQNSTCSQCCQKFRTKTDPHRKFFPQSMLSKYQGKNKGLSGIYCVVSVVKISRQKQRYIWNYCVVNVVKISKGKQRYIRNWLCGCSQCCQTQTVVFKLQFFTRFSWVLCLFHLSQFYYCSISFVVSRALVMVVLPKYDCNLTIF